jgi:hypothetical protein
MIYACSKASSAAPLVGTTLSEVQEAVATGEAGDALAVSTAVGLKVRWKLIRKMLGKLPGYSHISESNCERFPQFSDCQD